MYITNKIRLIMIDNINNKYKDLKSYNLLLNEIKLCTNFTKYTELLRRHVLS